MTIKKIKQAINDGKNVYWSNTAYKVIKDNLGQYLIVCTINNHAIGLHGVKGSKYENVLNGEEKDFFINAR